MINNDMTNPLERYFTSRNAGGAKAADWVKQMKERRAAINGKTADETETAQSGDEAASKNAAKGKSADSNLSAEERRQKEIKAILDEINMEEAAKTASASSDSAQNAQQVAANGTESGDVDQYGFPSFLNDLPIFDQFKTDLLSAFNNLDGATAGSISAQFELNYNSVQTIANEFGGYDVTETSYSFKLDLNYVKAAAGADKNASLSDLFGGDKTEKTTPSSLMDNLKDYFSPQNTANRIVDFATSFFPASAQFKKGGDTDESRSEFAEVMRDAIQKGFDQAMGTLGKVPQSVQDGIDETHDLTFQGIDDFVKYGMGRGKDQQNANNDIMSMLQQFSVSMSQSYNQKTYSYTPGASTYGSGGTVAATDASRASGIDAQA